MPYPEILLVHRCRITQRRSTSALDEYGNPIITETTLSERRCRLHNTPPSTGTNGVIYTATCVMKPTADVEADDKLSSENAGFNKTYWVNSVRHVSEVDGRLSHTTLELRETEHREVT